MNRTSCFFLIILCSPRGPCLQLQFGRVFYIVQFPPRTTNYIVRGEWRALWQTIHVVAGPMQISSPFLNILIFGWKVRFDRVKAGRKGRVGGGCIRGNGRCRRVADTRSPGASNATAGTPNVVARREARAPPRECPTSQMLASVYICLRSPKRFCFGCQFQSDRQQGFLAYHPNGIKETVLHQSVRKTGTVAFPMLGITVANGCEHP